MLRYLRMSSGTTLFDFPNQPGRWGKVLPYALLLGVTLGLYGASLYFYFVWDDFAYIVKNYRIQGLDWAHVRAFWTGTYLHHYAPVHHTLLALLYHFSGLNPFGYHLAQVLLHAGCVCLVYFIVRKLESPRVAMLASLLFAVHPANVETVAWISETKSTLAFLFFLLSFWCYLRFREKGHPRERMLDGLLAGLFLVLSVLAKINTVVAPAIFLLYDYKAGASLKKLQWRSLIPFFLISAIFTLVHLASFHGGAQVMESEYMGGIGVHLLNMPLLLSFYLQMTVFPYSLSAWEMYPIQEGFTALAALGWLGFFGLAFLLARSRRNSQFWGLWIFVFLLPVLQIIPFNVWVADRYLYIPAIGGFVLLSEYLFGLRDRLQRPLARWSWEAAVVGAVLLLAWRTQRHLPVWTNDLTLWAATTPTCMTSAYCHTNLGTALLQNGQMELGIQELERAVEIRPHPVYLERLGDAYAMAARDYGRALHAYRLALESSGASPGREIYGKLARAYWLAGDFEQASRAIEAGKRVSTGDPGLWIAAGFLEWKLGNWESARQSIRRALVLSGSNFNVAGYLTEFWGQPGEVGRMLSDLNPL
ncbi:MAG: glycosyltransferase family 39 protein [Acidobacteria bacterium]|nr:glycosyltransferase family 39 protein [Acidobacteriota bacterium]